MAKILFVLIDLENRLPSHERPRFLSRIDHTSLLKSPEGVLEKMVRDWQPTNGPPKIGFDSFLNDIEDLGRFRIVANFLSDMILIRNTLLEAYKGNEVSPTEAQKALHDEFILKGNCMEDLVTVKPDERKKGERCCKCVFYPRKEELQRCKVEVQILTQLQEAWDKKDHFLIYEPRRRGEPIDLQDEIEIFSMSELLYVADLTFERLKKGVIERRQRKGERNAPSG